MLSKLIGYEWKATRRIYLPAFLAIAVLSVLNAITLTLYDSGKGFGTPGMILLMLYIFAMFAIWVLAFGYMIVRFNRNLLGDEGYLMFTLPAKPSELIASKAIMSTIWMILTAFVCAVSLFLIVTPLMIAGNGGWIYFWRNLQLTNAWNELVNVMGFNLVTIPLELLVLGVIGTFASCLHFYSCLSLGALANRHRLAWAFGAYVAFGVVQNILSALVMYILDRLSFLDNFAYSLTPNGQVNAVLILFIVWYIIWAIINFAITNYVLSRHLNLQ